MRGSSTSSHPPPTTESSSAADSAEYGCVTVERAVYGRRLLRLVVGRLLRTTVAPTFVPPVRRRSGGSASFLYFWCAVIQ